MNRAQLLAQISRALGRRQLVWFGTRGDDIQSALDLPNLAMSFSVVNTFSGSSSTAGTSLERHSRVRVDLDAHDIDDDFGTRPFTLLRAELLDVLRSPSAIFTYRPSTLVSAACFTRPEAQCLGMFKDHQSAFEHKPWVESAVAGLGIPRVQWRYLPADDVRGVETLLGHGPVVVRRSRSSGGAGIAKVSRTSDFESFSSGSDGLVSVSSFIADSVPVNIGAVVWRDGVTVHLPSVQLIGHPRLTSRTFGYCGNDFAAICHLGDETIDRLESMTRAIGEWLRGAGYRGAFGVDFLVTEGMPLFLEVNPRFQGSTHLSVAMSRLAGESCLLSEHLAAFLGFDVIRQAPLRERVRSTTPAAHIVHHWLSPSANAVDLVPVVSRVSRASGYELADVLLPSHTACWVGATLARYTFRRGVTATGFDLDDDIASLLVQPEERFDPSQGVRSHEQA